MSRDALHRVIDTHNEHLFSGETKGVYSVEDIESLINDMGTLAQQKAALMQEKEMVVSSGGSGDTLHINASGGATKVSIKGEKNSRGMNWEVRIEETAKGAEDLLDLQARVEKAFHAAVLRMSEKYGAPGGDK